MNVKKMHAVHKCRSAEDFQSFLATTDLGIGKILGDVATEGATATVFVVGSIPKGFGRPESDVDLLVLVERDSQVRRDGHSIVFHNGSDGRFLSHKYFADGVEFGVDVCSLEALSGLVASVELLLRALGQPQKLGALPVLPYEDIRFLDVVRNGWVIHDPAFAGAVRERLKSALLPLYCASFYYIQHLEALEDCYSLRDEEAEVFATNVRICAHRATLSLLAARGITDPNERWLWKYVHRFFGGAGHPGDEQLFRLLRRLSFISPQASPQERLDSLRDLRQLGAVAEGTLSTEPKLAGVVAALRAKLAYVFDDQALKATADTATP